jgi:lantibiotic modifying enzyme
MMAIHQQMMQAPSSAGMQGGWRPLLCGALCDRARQVVEEIAEALRPQPATLLSGEPVLATHEAALFASLSSGAAGLAIFFAYLAQLDGRAEQGAQVVTLLEQAMEGVSATPMSPALHGGFTGVGWSVAHLVGRFIDPGDEDANTAIDEFLLDYLRQQPWEMEYDLISGLVGFGVYALERLPNPKAVLCLERIVDQLSKLAHERAEGIAWWTPPHLLPEWQRKRCPQGYHNLGLAHGIPGILALLGHTYAAGVATLQCRSLLERAVPWLLAQQIDGPASGFPVWRAAEHPVKSARLAWCYGDPGVAAALLVAARCTQRTDWEKAAIAIARQAAQRPHDEAGIADAGLCHGAAGLGHLFNRMHQATGDPLLGQAAQHWLTYTIEMRQPGRGVAGFPAWAPGEDDPNPWKSDPGLLAGAAGVGLALLAATTPIPPLWDRTLLVDIPLHPLP